MPGIRRLSSTHMMLFHEMLRGLGGGFFPFFLFGGDSFFLHPASASASHRHWAPMKYLSFFPRYFFHFLFYWCWIGIHDVEGWMIKEEAGESESGYGAKYVGGPWGRAWWRLCYCFCYCYYCNVGGSYTRNEDVVLYLVFSSYMYVLFSPGEFGVRK